MGRRAKLNAKKRNRRILYISVVVAIVAVIVVLALVVNAVSNDPYSKYIYEAVPTGVMAELTGVSTSTLNAIGSVSTVNPPAAINGSADGNPLTANGKPEVLYVGGEYCPYCAFERWGMIVALSRFGNFTGVEYMQSSSTDVNANTPTFTFEAANFTSPYITFVPVEEFNRTSETVAWHTLTPAQESLVTTYSTGGIPFIDIGNSYVVTGVQDQLVLTTNDLSGQNWTAVISQLNNSQSTIAQGIDGTANTLITAICKIDGAQPASVCTQPYGTIPLAYTTTAGTVGGPTGLQTDLELAVMTRAEPRWTS
jgi:hypothetical protein